MRSGEFQCPWCERESENRADFRAHLMVEHRKSDLADYVADRVEESSAEHAEAVPA